MKLRLPILCLTVLALTGAPSLAQPPATPTPTPRIPLTDFSKLKDGDLVFIKSSTDRADAIEKVTGSSLTHCGIIFLVGDSEPKERMVYEGAGRGINKHLNMRDWQLKESGYDPDHPPAHPILHEVYARRWKDMPTDKIGQLKDEASKLHNTPYDFGFAFENRDGNGTEYIYCSELIYKAFKKTFVIDLGNPRPLSSYYSSLDEAHAREVRKVLDKYLNKPESKACRGGQPYNPAEMTISPKQVDESTLLQDVTD